MLVREIIKLLQNFDQEKEFTVIMHSPSGEAEAPLTEEMPVLTIEGGGAVLLYGSTVYVL